MYKLDYSAHDHESIYSEHGEGFGGAIRCQCSLLDAIYVPPDCQALSVIAEYNLAYV